MQYLYYGIFIAVILDAILLFYFAIYTRDQICIKSNATQHVLYVIPSLLGVNDTAAVLEPVV